MMIPPLVFFFAVDAPDEHAVVQGTESHDLLL